ncbi:MAG: hypothetical protein LBC35_08035 [Coriobacteriales bacterium]|jgi:hypothetical protein|nr:hypothetical protein [Coriobacteriales bacterium]
MSRADVTIERTPWGLTSGFLVRVCAALVLITILAFAMMTAGTLRTAFASDTVTSKAALSQDSSGDEGRGTTDDDTAPPTYDAQDLVSAQTNHSQANIPDPQVPLKNMADVVNGSFGAPYSQGSFVNTGLAIICVLSMVVLVIALVRRKQPDFKIVVVRTAAMAVGLVTVSTWSLVDKLAVPSLVVNNSSILIASLFVLYAAVAVASVVLERSNTKKTHASRR